MLNRHLFHPSFLQQDKGRQKTVHTREEWYAAGVCRVHHLQRTTGVLHPVVGHHSSESVGYLRLQFLESSVLAVGADAHHQFMIVDMFQQQVEVVWCGLQVSIHAAVQPESI